MSQLHNHDMDNNFVLDEILCQLKQKRGVVERGDFDSTTISSDISGLIVSLFDHCEREHQRAFSHDSKSDEKWRQWISHVRLHPLHACMLESDTISRLAYQQLRGYAGDACLLDYIYYGSNPSDIESQWTRSFLSAVYLMHPPFAVRQRAAYIGRWVDQLASTKNDIKTPFRTLSVASGHCREMTCSSKFLSGDIHLVALDQDEQSVQHTTQELHEIGSLPVTCINESISSLIQGKSVNADQQFDAIYSSGLFDYLNEKVAAKLIHRLFMLLKPGGSLLIANLMNTLYGVAYMEAFQNWFLIYRDIPSMQRLVDLAKLPSSHIDQQSVTVGSTSCVYLEIHRSMTDMKKCDAYTPNENECDFRESSFKPMRANL